MTKHTDNVRKFNGPSVVPSAAEYAQVGMLLDDLKELWENNEIGSLAVVYCDRQNKNISTEWVSLPGISIFEIVGWAQTLVADLIARTKK